MSASERKCQYEDPEHSHSRLAHECIFLGTALVPVFEFIPSRFTQC
jgi:hypothetical protein